MTRAGPRVDPWYHEEPFSDHDVRFTASSR
jgi:hypothetical protein